jgi:aspartyl/asparaginyl beta-hydroxylase (cupin superfamily)
VSSLAEQQTKTAADQKLSQRFGTYGIKPLARASVVTRMNMRVVALIEQLNLTCSQVGNQPTYDNAQFPWMKAIELEWRAIRTELDRVQTRLADLPGFYEISSDVATISQNRGWKTFLLSGYGFKSDANIILCRQTWLICPIIPGLITVMFSMLELGKHLPLHRGPYNGVLGLNLG